MKVYYPTIGTSFTICFQLFLKCQNFSTINVKLSTCPTYRELAESNIREWMLSAASLLSAVSSIAWNPSNAVILSANCNPMLNLKNLIHPIIAFLKVKPVPFSFIKVLLVT